MAGGPIQSIAALTYHLSDTFEFSIITADTDFGATEPYRDVVPDTWTNYAGRRVYYISQPNLNMGTIRRLLKETTHDILYLNSMFSPYFTIAPLRLRRGGKINSRVVLAPRGMLSQGALKTKTAKKNIFLALANMTGLFRGITWQSTSPQEITEIRRRIGPGAEIREASNLPNVPAAVKPIEKEAGTLKLCNIARICDTKNVHFAIEVLTRYKGQGQIVFDIYGPIEDPAYWDKCRHTAAKLPPNVTMHYGGSIPPSQVADVLAVHHALFLPSYNENFGHGIVEALLSARPVLISDQTPWRHLRQQQVGFDLDLSAPDTFLSALEELVSLDDTVFQHWCTHATDYIHQQLSIDQIKQAYKKLFA